MEHSSKIWLFIRIFALDFSVITADLSIVTTCTDISGLHMKNALLQGKPRDTIHKSAVLHALCS